MISEKQIEAARNIYKDLKKWNLANNTISSFFSNNPKNKKLDIILIKVLLIDSLYKTNLKDQISVAEHIYKISSLDDELKRKNLEIVDKVAKWNNTLQNKTINLLSFASKFCYFHDKKTYPLYDKYVVIALKKFLPDWKDERNFLNFLDAITQLCRENKIERISFEDLDKFLWLYGLLLRLKENKTDINREIYEYYKSHGELFAKLEEE